MGPGLNHVDSWLTFLLVQFLNHMIADLFICDVGHVWALISKVECRINDGLKLQFVVASFLSTSTENPLTPGRLKDQRDRSRGFFLLLHFWHQTRTVYLVVIGFRPARYCAYVKKYIYIYIYTYTCIHTHMYCRIYYINNIIKLFGYLLYIIRCIHMCIYICTFQ